MSHRIENLGKTLRIRLRLGGLNNVRPLHTIYTSMTTRLEFRCSLWRMKTTKQLVLVAVVALALCGCAIPQRSSEKWEYRVLSGYTKPRVGPATLQEALKDAGDEGWEAVSWTQVGDNNPPYFNVLLKRTRR